MLLKHHLLILVHSTLSHGLIDHEELEVVHLAVFVVADAGDVLAGDVFGGGG